MTLATIIEGNTLLIEVSVRDKDGGARDLTGATIEASARRASVSVAASSAQVSDAAAGVARVGFDAGGYAYDPERSEPDRPVFVRPYSV